MTIAPEIEIISKIPFPGFSDLMAESEREGYHFLIRLAKHWQDSTNQFSLPGEGLYQVKSKGELIGIGGINRDPYSKHQNVGRIRRFYIKSSWRKQKMGSFLLRHILNNHFIYFDTIVLRTNSELAGRFYEKHGFAKVDHAKNLTHRITKRGI